MRGDGLGVGDLGEVPCRAWGRRHSSCCGDSGSAARKLESVMDSGCIRAELDASRQPRRHRIGIDDGARVRHGGSRAYRPGSDRTHGMRGDGLGVGDVGEVLGRTWDDELKTDCNHNRAPWRKHEPGLVRGRCRAEHGAPRQQSWIRIGIHDGARGKHGRSRLHDKRSTGTHGMRGDRLGVGDLGEVP